MLCMYVSCILSRRVEQSIKTSARSLSLSCLSAEISQQPIPCHWGTEYLGFLIASLVFSLTLISATDGIILLWPLDRVLDAPLLQIDGLEGKVVLDIVVVVNT